MKICSFFLTSFSIRNRSSNSTSVETDLLSSAGGPYSVLEHIFKILILVFNYSLHSIIFCISIRHTAELLVIYNTLQSAPRYFQHPPGTTHSYYNIIGCISCAVLVHPCNYQFVLLFLIVILLQLSQFSPLCPPLLSLLSLICTSKSVHLFLPSPPTTLPLTTISFINIFIEYILYARLCSRPWRSIVNEQIRHKTLPYYSLHSKMESRLQIN